MVIRSSDMKPIKKSEKVYNTVGRMYVYSFLYVMKLP